MPTHGALGLDGFNRLTDRARMHLLFEVCSSTIWARRVLAGGPFADVEALLDRADRVLAELPDAEIDAALDGQSVHQLPVYKPNGLAGGAAAI